MVNTDRDACENISKIIAVASLCRPGTEHFLGPQRASVMRLMAIALALSLTACSVFPDTSCPAGLTPMTQTQLFFGLSIPAGGEVSEAEWQRFVDDEITPRFPDGLTIEAARGQWEGASGIARESAKHLIIVLPRSETAKLDALRSAYKGRFDQDSVLLVESRVCGSF